MDASIAIRPVLDRFQTVIITSGVCQTKLKGSGKWTFPVISVYKTKSAYFQDVVAFEHVSENVRFWSCCNGEYKYDSSASMHFSDDRFKR